MRESVLRNHIRRLYKGLSEENKKPQTQKVAPIVMLGAIFCVCGTSGFKNNLSEINLYY